MEEEALEFAINAHKGQVRKSQKEKPMIIHPINVANILREYNFDSNVISAGYLHDVVEDTSYTQDDILNKFGEDINSLVLSATEIDKSLSWEERKQHTIDIVKTLDLRHKAVICADKISNLEDIIYMSEIKGEYDFSNFKRGYDSQKWYYENIYESLLSNNLNHPMFTRLKELIDQAFNKKENEIEKIFDSKEEYAELNKLHYKKQELKKMKTILTNIKPYIIEFTGTPRTGKTTLINNLNDFFKKGGFNVNILEEFTTSKKYKEEIYPLFKDKYKVVVNTEIPKYVYKFLKEAIDKNPDIIIVDRSLFDRMIWVDRLYSKNEMTDKEYNDYLDYYLPIIKDNIDIVVSTYTDSTTSLKRDYNANLSLEKRRFLNVENINEYNNSLNNMENYAKENNINFYKFDTTNKTEREISILVANQILDDMRKKYIDELNKVYKK